MAIGFMKAVRGAGLSIPDDVAVVGFDGIEFADYCDPPLTTCVQPTLKLGKAGVDLLFDIMETSYENVPNRTVIESTLVVRGSSVKVARVAARTNKISGQISFVDPRTFPRTRSCTLKNSGRVSSTGRRRPPLQSARKVMPVFLPIGHGHANLRRVANVCHLQDARVA